MFINESGLYSLILRSEKPEATPLDSGLTIKRKLRSWGGERESPLDANAKQSMYSNESGLCSLIMRSEKPEATPLDSGLRGSWAMPTRSKQFG